MGGYSPAGKKNVEAVITDVAGRIIYQKSFYNILSNALTIDFSSEPPGVYLLIVKVDNEMVTRKIVVGR